MLESLDPSVFVVSAKKTQIGKSDQYRDEEHRKILNTTTNRANQTSVEADIADKMRETKFNLQKTNISEYGNALNRGQVFVNPKFSSC